MASFSIHLAVGKRYLEKSNLIKNEKEFYNGIIDPDLVKDKKISHYTGFSDTSNLVKASEEKVLLYEFLKHENIDSDYQKGVFLHLITDYLFFNSFFDSNFLSNISYLDFCKDLYYSYGITNNYIDTTYNLDYSDFIDKIQNNIKRDKKEKHTFDQIGKDIIPIPKLSDFIEYVSNIDLDNYKEKIIKNNGNILP